jgi:PAS domain S-box-containing protein
MLEEKTGINLDGQMAKYFGLAALFWTALVAVLLYAEISSTKEHSRRTAISEARSNFNKDRAFRYWGTNHGGVYVPATEQTPPNPYLNHVAERDITTPSGKRLTLMNPAYMVRQMNEQFADDYGIVGHITSLKLHNPNNVPDAWERDALKSFERGVKEKFEFTEIDGAPYVRLMRPMISKKGCLKCHAYQGYKEGDVRGGVGVAVPLKRILADEQREVRAAALSFGIIWAIGLIGIGLSSRGLKTQIRRRLTADEKLTESEERFRTISEVSTVAIYLTDPDRKCHYANPLWLAHAGMTLEAAQGDGWTTALHPDDRERVFSSWDRMVQSRGQWGTDCRFMTPEGNVTWVHGTANTIEDSAGNITGYVGINVDITERKRAEEQRSSLEAQFQHAQKLESLGVLAGGIAHDFNNLLTSILGNAELALSDTAHEAPVRSELEDIRSSAMLAADLTRQMLAYSGKGRFVVKDIDLNEVIEEMGHLLDVSISKSIVIQYDLMKSLPAVNGDATQVQQVVMNLITNASEAIGDKNGVVSLSTKTMQCDAAYLTQTYQVDDLPAGLYVCLEVADTGVGMDAETLLRVFEPFFTTKFSGRGLGMAAVLGIVRGHRGAIKVNSEPGHGTTFKILLPASGPAVVQESRASLKTADWQGKGSVLLVDDDASVRTVGKKILEKLGFSVVTAFDGLDALEIFRERGTEFSFVLLDLTMPRMGGEDCFRELRRIAPNARVILTSGYAADEVTQRFAGKGLTDFISKPFEIEKMKEVILRTLEGSDPHTS